MENVKDPLSHSIEMIVQSVTRSGSNALSEIEAERLLNAITRTTQGVPTGLTKLVTEQDTTVR